MGAKLAENLLVQEKFAEAEPILEQALATREKAAPNDWTTFDTRSALGASLLGQEKYADAQPLLLTGYEGLKQRQETIPAKDKKQITKALERIVQLFEKTEKNEDAAEWRQELDRFTTGLEGSKG